MSNYDVIIGDVILFSKITFLEFANFSSVLERTRREELNAENSLSM